MEVAIKVGDEGREIKVVIEKGEPHGMNEESYGEGGGDARWGYIVCKEGRGGDRGVENESTRGVANRGKDDGHP